MVTFVHGLRDAQRKIRGAVFTLTLVGVAMWCAAVVRAEPGDNHLITVDLASGLATGAPIGTAVPSSDGRYIAFDVTSLAAGGSPWRRNVFVHDRASGITERVSVGMDGTGPDGDSSDPVISGDGRFVAFSSVATNLVPGNDDGLQWDAFVRDRVQGMTREASLASNGADLPCWAYANGISDDGRYVALWCGEGGVFLRDMVARTTTQIVAIGSVAAYVRMSGDGRYVLYNDYERGGLSLYDRITATTAQLVRGTYGMSPSMSRDGRWVAYRSPWPEVATDTNEAWDVFLLDRSTGEKRRVSVSATGQQSNADSWPMSVSDDGRYVAFTSTDGQLVPGAEDGQDNVLIKDMHSGAVEFVAPNGWGALSGDGRVFALATRESLVPADLNMSYDVYVHEVGRSSTLPVHSYNLRPQRIDFGEVRVSYSLRRGFQLVNTGPDTLPLTTVEITGPNRTQFSLRNYCPAALAPTGRCWIAVSFEPTSIGEKRARLHVVAGGIERNRLVKGIALR
jgi:Tol biopolymer transport system component